MLELARQYGNGGTVRHVVFECRRPTPTVLHWSFFLQYCTRYCLFDGVAACGFSFNRVFFPSLLVFFFIFCPLLAIVLLVAVFELRSWYTRCFYTFFLKKKKIFHLSFLFEEVCDSPPPSPPYPQRYIHARLEFMSWGRWVVVFLFTSIERFDSPTSGVIDEWIQGTRTLFSSGVEFESSAANQTHFYTFDGEPFFYLHRSCD